MSPSSKMRLWGGVFLGFGLLMFKIGVIDVLSAARAGAPVKTYLKASLGAPGFVILGVLLLVMGVPTGKPSALGQYFVTGHGPDSRLKPLGYVVVLLVVGAGLLMHAWVNHRLAEMGYE